MARHRVTGLIRQRTDKPQYGDYSNVGDYQEALNTVLVADQMFGELDSNVRARFGNDPQQLLDFCENPDNQTEAIELGIASAKEPQPEPATEPVTGENPIIGGE